MLVSTWLEDWYQLHKAGIRPRTAESYRDLLDRYVLPSIGHLDLSDLNAPVIRHFLSQICEKGHSRTAELVFVMLKCAFSDLENSPLARVMRPSHVQRSPAAWSDEEIAAYMAACRLHKHGIALSLGLVLGLRRGEICGLRWQDFDFDARTVHICNQRLRLADGRIVDGPPKSATSDRVLPLPEPLCAALRPVRGVGAAYVTSLTPSGLDTAHRKLVRALGLPPIPLHGLRHSMAPACIRHGGDMRALQQLLGHANYATTANRYTHPDAEMLRSAIDCAAVSCYTVLHV